MDIINNQGEKIGSLTNAVSNDRSITINRIHDVTIGRSFCQRFFGV
jgi:hypothetical protein